VKQLKDHSHLQLKIIKNKL